MQRFAAEIRKVPVIFGYREELSKQHHNVNLRGANTLDPGMRASSQVIARIIKFSNKYRLGTSGSGAKCFATKYTKI